MELLIFSPYEAVFVQKLLNIFDLNAKILSRDKGYMIYIKEAEKISDYIKILGANNAVMYFENVRVYRDKKNKTNRLNNCEQANIDKVFQTAAAQLEQIEIIENGGSSNIKNIMNDTFAKARANDTIDKNRYYAEAIISLYDWEKIGIEEFTVEERNNLIKRIQEEHCIELYNKLQEERNRAKQNSNNIIKYNNTK